MSMHAPAVRQRNPARSRRAPRARGFTLVELMVAMTGGLFVSMVVFALARDGSRFYQRESRIAEATLGSVIGFDRLKNDIARAGYLSTPNVSLDPTFCGSPLADLAGIGQLPTLASIQITADAAAALNPVLQHAPTAITPHSILLSGAYDSVERFDATAVFPDGNNRFVVRLQSTRGALFRLNYANLSAGERLLLLAQLFPANRALRLSSTDSGTFQMGVITGTDVDATGTPVIYLALAPALRLSGASATRCNASTHQLVNVVNFIRYTLRTVRGNTTDYPNHQQLFSDAGAPPGESDRLELVREELGVNGVVVAGSREVIAEYAVDLRFSITRVLNPLTATPTLTTDAFGSANVLTIAGSTTNPLASPQSVRSVRARLSVRSREADRDANVATGSNIAPGLYRIGLGDDSVNSYAPFARVRTLQADILIGSQSEVVTW